MKRLIFALGLLLIVCGLSQEVTTAPAQTYPNRPIQLIIAGAAGSILDIAGRLFGEEIGKILGTQLIPVDKPGAGFTLGTDFVVKSKKDGYTLLYTNSSAIVNARVLNPETVPYDPDKDLEPIGLALFISGGIAVQTSSPWKTFAELLDYAKKNPGQIRFSTNGIGSTGHLNMEIIQALTGTQFTHIPFKAGDAVSNAVLGGHVEMTFDVTSKLVPHVQSEKLRILLVDKKLPGLPDIPTMTDLGYKHDLCTSWLAMYGPAGLPEEAKSVLIPAFEKAAKNPELKAKLEKMLFVVDYKTPAELKTLAAEQYEALLEIAKKVGLRKTN
jgi:tripartite-type tricarboxylate transporter receptor subunit TctC